MATLTARAADEGFILSEASGFRSRDAVTLKAGSAYLPGSVVIAEYTESTPESGNFDTATGSYVIATADLVAAYETVIAAIVCRYTDATDVAADAAVIARDAEVKNTELVYGAGTVEADLAAALADAGIVVRAAI